MEIETLPKENIVAEIELIYKPRIKIRDLPKIQSPQEAYELFLSAWDKSKLQFVEQFKIMLLNRANRVLGICTLSTGGTNSTVIDMKILFVVAIKTNSSSIIVAHNHPSGNLVPSDVDRSLTVKIKSASKLMEVSLQDHLIVTEDGYYSFTEEGAL